MAKLFMAVTDALGNVAESQRIGTKHRTSQVAREAVAAGPDHIDIRGARRSPFFEYAIALMFLSIGRCCKIWLRSVC